jgi:hypothetical protein
MVHRPIFTSVYRAKSYLINRIAEQAVREGSPLNDAEVKLLYFTEREPTIADEVIDEFPDYDPKYESKVTKLLQRRFRHEQSLPGGGESKSFLDAFELLKTEDHYLVVMAEPVLGQRVRSDIEWTSLTAKQVVLVVVALAGGVIFGAWMLGRMIR